MSWLQDPIVRGLITAVLSAVLTALTTWAGTDSTKAIIIAAGTTFCTVLLSSWGLTKLADRYRQGSGAPA